MKSDISNFITVKNPLSCEFAMWYSQNCNTRSIRRLYQDLRYRKLNWAFPSNNFLGLHFKNFLQFLLWVMYFYPLSDCKKKQAKTTGLTFWHLYYTNAKMIDPLQEIFFRFVKELCDSFWDLWDLNAVICIITG